MISEGQRGEVGLLEHRGLKEGPLQNRNLDLCIGDLNVDRDLINRKCYS